MTVTYKAELPDNLSATTATFVTALLADYTTFNWNPPEKLWSYHRWTNQDNSFQVLFNENDPSQIKVDGFADAGWQTHVATIDGDFTAMINYAMGL